MEETEVVDILTDNINRPERLPNESYEAYRLRRTVSNQKRKESLKGRMIWDSKTLGTYRK